IGRRARDGAGVSARDEPVGVFAVEQIEDLSDRFDLCAPAEFESPPDANVQLTESISPAALPCLAGADIDRTRGIAGVVAEGAVRDVVVGEIVVEIEPL